MTAHNHKKFPSGRSVARVKQDAKKLKKNQGITISEALDTLAKENGVDLPWNQAISSLIEEPNGNR